MAASPSLPPPISQLSSLSVSSPSLSPSTAPPPPPFTQAITYRAYAGESDLQTIVDLVEDELSEPYNLYTYRYFLDTWLSAHFSPTVIARKHFRRADIRTALSGSTPLGVIISKCEPHSKSHSSTLIPFSSPSEESVWVNEVGGQVVVDERTGEHKRCRMRGYLAMLSVRKDARGKGIATHLLRLSLTSMLSLPSSYLSSLPTPHPSRWLQGPDELVLETEDDNLQALGFYKKMGFVREKGLFRFYLNGKGAGRLRLDLTERGVGVVGGGKGEGVEEVEGN